MEVLRDRARANGPTRQHYPAAASASSNQPPANSRRAGESRPPEMSLLRDAGAEARSRNYSMSGLREFVCCTVTNLMTPQECKALDAQLRDVILGPGSKFTPNERDVLSTVLDFSLRLGRVKAAFLFQYQLADLACVPKTKVKDIVKG